MERKLELKDVSGYFPYGLKVLHDGYVKEAFAIGFQVKNPMVSLFWDDGKRARNDNFDLNTCKPVLRPLSNLCKTIIHNGKEIVPIVELAKIAFPNTAWILSKDFEEKYCAKYLGLEFNFVKHLKSFYIWRVDEDFGVNNQYILFDYLHELKIDYRGLIDAGLAISVYGLPENP